MRVNDSQLAKMNNRFSEKLNRPAAKSAGQKELVYLFPNIVKNPLFMSRSHLGQVFFFFFFFFFSFFLIDIFVKNRLND